MRIQEQITELLQANFEGLPLADRLSAASAMSTLYHFVVDNDLEADYCSRQPILTAADRLYTALLMSYVTSESLAQATNILLAQADVIFGLQAVPNRRRADCFLAATKKHLAQTNLSHIQDETSFRKLAYLSQTFGNSLPQEVEAYIASTPEEDIHTTSRSASIGRFSALQNTIEKLEQEIQSSLFV